MLFKRRHVAIILPTLTPAHFDLTEDTYMLNNSTLCESRAVRWCDYPIQTLGSLARFTVNLKCNVKYKNENRNDGWNADRTHTFREWHCEEDKWGHYFVYHQHHHSLTNLKLTL